MIFDSMPDGFWAKFHIVSCFVEYGGKILLLHRQDHKPQPNTLGVPAGKVDGDEHIDQAVQRELFEETGISSNEMIYFDKLYVRYDDFDFIYHIYHLVLDQEPNVVLRPDEHKGFIWKTPKEALQTNLIEDLDSCIKLFYMLA